MLKQVCLGHKGQDSKCCPGHWLSEDGCQENVDCVQLSAAVVCLCLGSHGLSRRKDVVLTFGNLHTLCLVSSYDIVAESVGGLRLTSSGEMLRTGMPLISSTWSPVWTEDSMSGQRAAESNLRESDNG